jgi:RNA polymerase sigma-70 factor (ECF subfamily)
VDLKIRRLLASGEPRLAIELMAREYQRVLYSTAYRILGNVAQAQDALQETFIDALRDVDSYQGRSPIRAWLLKICAHRAIDLARRQRRSEQWQVAEELADEVPESVGRELPVVLDERLWYRALEDCLLQLTPEVRAALILRFQHGLSYEEIAKICDEKPGTLQARVSRAMPVLRRCLVAKGWER